MKQNPEGGSKLLNRVFAGFGGIMALSPAVATVLTLAIAAFALFALVSSILIWPVLIRCCSSADPEAQKAISLCIAAGIGLALSSVVAVVLAYKMENFTFATGMLPAFFINLTACVAGIAVSGLTVLNPVLNGLSGSGLMNLTVQFFFAIMCAVLPSVIAGLIGIAFYGIASLFLNLKS